LGAYSASSIFGSITNIVSNFEFGYMDGIVGFAYSNAPLDCSPTCVQTLFSNLVQSTSISPIFAIFIDYNDGGSLSLGGYDPSILNGTLGYTSVTKTDYYNVNLQKLLLGPYTVASGSSATFGSAIVDSGTTLTLLPQNVYSSLQSYFQTYYYYLPLVTGSETLFEGYCFLSSTSIGQFPTIYFLFNGVTVPMGPQNYIYQTLDTQGRTAYCLGIEVSSDGNTILGDTFMRGQYVVFDQQNNRVGFGPTNAVPSYPISGASSLVPSLLFLMSVWATLFIVSSAIF